MPGHWEGDLITGRANQPAIETLVERASGALMLVDLPGRHTAEVTAVALTAAFAGLPPSLRRSLTWDRGTEMSDHAQLSQATGISVFVVDPHAPWQRGSNENLNGLLRQYFPKGSNRAVHSPARLTEVETELNSTPAPESATNGSPQPKARDATVGPSVGHCCVVHWNSSQANLGPILRIWTS